MEYFKPFFVKIAGRARDDDHTSAHEQIIAPLLQNALAAYVYNGRKDKHRGGVRQRGASAKLERV